MVRALTRFIGIVVLLAMFVAPVRAQVRARVHMGVENPTQDTECIVASGLADGVSARLGYDPFDDTASDNVSVHVQRRSAALVIARVSLAHGRESGGERELRASTCAELRELLVLTVALAIDPLASTSDQAAAATHVEPSAEPASAVQGPDARPVQVYIAPVEEPGTPAHPLIGADVHLSSGTAPALAWGAGIFAGLAWNSFSLRLEVRGDLPTRMRVGAGNVETSLMLASLLGCVSVSLFDLCGGMRAGAQRSTGLGLDHASSFTSAVVAVAVRGYFNLPLSDAWDLSLGVDFAFALTQTTLFVDDNAIWTTPLASVGVLLGPIYRFP